MRIVSFEPGVPGVFAFGAEPIGIISVGWFARGLLVVAQFGVGVVVVAQVGVGLVVLGQIVCALLQGFGMFAMGGRVRGVLPLWMLPHVRTPRVAPRQRAWVAVEQAGREEGSRSTVRAGLELREGEPRLVFDGVSRGGGERLPDGRELAMTPAAREALIVLHRAGVRDVLACLVAAERREPPTGGFREAPPRTPLLTVVAVEEAPRAAWRSPFQHPYVQERGAPKPLSWRAGLLRIALWLALAAAYARFWVPQIAFAFGGDVPAGLATP
jgi:hypothetical protein